MSCKHKRTRRGKDANRLLYGSDRTVKCLDCKKWKLTDHYGKSLSRWRKTGYKEATADKPDMW